MGVTTWVPLELTYVVNAFTTLPEPKSCIMNAMTCPLRWSSGFRAHQVPSENMSSRSSRKAAIGPAESVSIETAIDRLTLSLQW